MKRIFLFIAVCNMAVVFSGCLGPLWGLYEVLKEEPQTENNAAPYVNLAPVGRQVDSNNIIIEFTLADLDKDNCSVSFEYKVGAGSWTPCTNISGVTTGLMADPDNVILSTHQVTWDAAAADITAGTAVLDICVAVTAHDGTANSPFTSCAPFIAGNDLPVVTILTPDGTGGDETGNVVITYTITDSTSDICSITVEYERADDPGVWHSATKAIGQGTGLASSSTGENQEWGWASGTDLLGEADDVVIRITPNDGNPGTPGVSASFFANNNGKPAVTYLSSQMIEENTFGIIPIPYRISDNEGDVCSIVLECSPDNVSWEACIEYPAPGGDGISGLESYIPAADPETKGTHLFLWNTFEQIGYKDKLVNLRLKAVDANSNESGEVYKSIVLANWSESMNMEHESIFTGYSPSTLCVEDFDQDGFPDLAIGHRWDQSVQTLYGSDTGLAGGTLYSIVLNGFEAIFASGDFNNDTFPDLATIGAYDDFDWYGSASGLGAVTTTGGDGDYVAAGDFNNDGYDDLASVDQFGDTVQIVYGSATGLAGTVYAVSVGARPLYIACGDWTGDNCDDIVTSNFDGNNASLITGGAAKTHPVEHIAISDYPRLPLVADVDMDGYGDILIADGDQNRVVVMYGESGGHGTPDYWAAGSQPWRILTGDFNSDTYTDVVCINVSSDFVTLWEGSSTGLQPSRDVAIGSGCENVCVADINDDGFPDLIGANRDANHIEVCLGNKNGLQDGDGFPANGDATTVEAADFNGDGKISIVCADEGGGYLNFFTGTTIVSRPPVNYPRPNDEYPRLVADVNADGYDDIVALGYTGSTYKTYIHFGGPTGIEKIEEFTGSFIMPYAFAFADIDQDGYVDMLIGDMGTSPTFLDSELYIQYGSASGFQPQQSLSYGTGPVSLLLADFDGNGYTDILWPDYIGTCTRLIPNSGTGLGTEVILLPGVMEWDMFAEDVNSDGYTDLIIGTDPQIDIYLGSASGITGISQSIVVESYEILFDDLNSDGLLDIIFEEDSGTNTIGICYNTPTGFQSPLYTPAFSYLWGFSTGDVNMDGFRDLLVTEVDTNNFIHRVKIFHGNTTGVTYYGLIDTGRKPRAPLCLDLDADGYQDVVTINNGSSSYSFLKGTPSGLKQAISKPVIAGPSLGYLGDFNHDSFMDLYIFGNDSEYTLVCGESGNPGETHTVDTSGGSYLIDIGRVKIDFELNAFASPIDATLWISAIPVEVTRPASEPAGTSWMRPVAVSSPFNLMPFQTDLETGKGGTVSLDLYPGVSNERLTWGEFRLYRYDSNSMADPLDDELEIIASTADGTLVIDVPMRTATTSGTGNISSFGRYQVFQALDDSDGDNLPDAWEMHYFSDLDEIATGNPDGDGADNRAEYEAETDPTV